MSNNVPLLTVDQLSVTYPSFAHHGCVKAVDQVSFVLEAGEVLALIGESGAGKSAIAHAILNLLPANAQSSGQIAYQGQLISAADRSALKKHRGHDIAMIFQDPSTSLDPVFSIGKQLDEVISLYEPRLSRVQRRIRAVELLTITGIPQPAERLKHYPHQFSGGQIQRIMIAIALAGRPKVLIADEPTTALDVTTQQEILDLLFTLNEQYQMAILLITHDMGVVADLAQRVIVMRNGKIVEQQPVEQLFGQPTHAYTRQLLAAIPSSAPDHSNENHTTVETPLLQVEHLSIRYPAGWNKHRTVVHDVSFAIPEGEFLGLLGESGSGKTTIGRSLLGIVPPASGTVHLASEPLIADGKYRASTMMKAKIGAIFQNPLDSLNPRMTIRQSIAEPLLTHVHWDYGKVDERVSELLDHVGLPIAWGHKYPYELSGGQNQRVAIARAIALKPQLLIADEPTSALDVSIQQSVLQLLHELQQEYRFACLFITHDLTVTHNLCQSVMVLNQGKVVEQGTVGEVFLKPTTHYTRTLLESVPSADPRYQQEKRQQRYLADQAEQLINSA